MICLFFMCYDLSFAVEKRWINLLNFAENRKLFGILSTNSVKKSISMNRLTATLLLSFLFFLLSFQSVAQLRLPGVGNADVKQALEKVISDFPKGFATLRGDVLNNNPQTVEYTSHLAFRSAENNTITEYSGKTPVYSWQALMLTNEAYEAAEKKYKSLYKDLKGISLTLNRDYSYGLEGNYDPPSEAKKFSTSIFHLTPSASNLPKVRVELSLQYEMMEWKIYLTVYQKEREDNERGKVKE